MEFTKIKFNEKSGVELAYTRKGEQGETETRNFSCAQPPKPELPAAFAAFIPYVADLLELPSEWREHLTITTLSLDEEPKTKRLGLIVTAIKPVEKANDRPLVLNTPR